MLLKKLESVKVTLWKESASLATKAAGVCTDKPPAKRAGGEAKCCTKIGHRSYTPTGFSQCAKAKTFDPVGSYQTDTGPLDWTHSTMIKDCCIIKGNTPSQCWTNEWYYTSQLVHYNQTTADSKAQITATQALIDAVTATLAQRETDINAYKTSLKTMCLRKVPVNYASFSGVDCSSKWPDCTSGKIVDQNVSCTKTIDNAKHNGDSMIASVNVIKKVWQWLAPPGTSWLAPAAGGGTVLLTASANAAGTSTLFSGTNTHRTSTSSSYSAADPTVAPSIAPISTVVSMVSMLETAKTHSAIANAGLDEAIQLIETASAATRSLGGNAGSAMWIKVETLLKKLLTKLVEAQDKMYTFAKTVRAECDKQCRADISEYNVLVTTKEAYQAQKGQAQKDKASHIILKSHYQDVVSNTADQYANTIKLREMNVEKCINYQSYFDVETVTRTNELLVLKKAIDIILHISCTTTAPTPAPTVKATDSPTAYPTANPTSTPTGYPTPMVTQTAQPTPAPLSHCNSGEWKYRDGVFDANTDDKTKLQFEIPGYMKGLTYKLPQTAVGSCVKVVTEHDNEVYGTYSLKGVASISHYYRCCPDGKFYGSIGLAPTTPVAVPACCSANGACNSLITAALTNVPNLCTAPSADYCGMFGSNLELVTAKAISCSAAQGQACVKYDTSAQVACGADKYSYTSAASGKTYCLTMGSATAVMH